MSRPPLTPMQRRAALLAALDADQDLEAQMREGDRATLAKLRACDTACVFWVYRLIDAVPGLAARVYGDREVPTASLPTPPRAAEQRARDILAYAAPEPPTFDEVAAAEESRRNAALAGDQAEEDGLRSVLGDDWNETRADLQ